MEIWKDIEGYEQLYQISTLGNVKSLNYNQTGKEKVLKTNKNKYKYLWVGLHKQGKRKHHYIHRLVASTFIPNPKNLPQINHRDEDKTNNRVENLEWCDAKYNINFGTRNEKISKKVLCVETGKIYTSTNEIQRQLGFAKGNISRCCNGKRKTCGSFHWKFVE